MSTPQEREDLLTSLAVELVLSVMASASTEKISPMDWWPRAKSALETAASEATCWREMVSSMARKLQVETLRESSASSVCLIEPAPSDFEDFRRIAERDAVYIVALAQTKRVEQRKAKAAREEATNREVEENMPL